MSNKIDYLELIFENCEIIRIESKNICKFLAEDISTSFYGWVDFTIKRETVNSFCLELRPQANIEYNPFGEKDWNTFVFDRIEKHSDLTHIRFTLDNKEYYFSLDWDEENEFSNSYQQTLRSSLGFLYLKVSRNKTLSDYFSKDYIENAEDINFE